ncbi:Zinc finger, CCHC-type [Sesbania bispinosa]|nr:Zinc finger, CCHC-type [Sesbania bispinosa]
MIFSQVRMPPRTRIPARREASGCGRSRGRRDVNAGRHGSATKVANAEVPRVRRGNPGMAEITVGLQGLQQVVQQFVGVVSEQQQGNQQQNLDGQQGVRQVDQQPGATAGGIEVTLAEFMKLKPPTFSVSNANEDPQRFIDGLERLWRALGCSDIQAVELASFQLEGVAYDWFDTVTRGRSVGSPPLAWEYSARFTQLSRHAPYPIKEEMRVKRFIKGLREYIFRSVVGSNCSTFAEVLSLGLQLEQRQKEKRNSGRDSHEKQRVEGSQSSHPSVGVGSVPGYQRHFGVTSTPCPTCGRHHIRACFGDSRVCYQCGQAGHIRRDCPVAVTQPSSSHASAPAALASSQAPSAPIRQLGGSSGIGILCICSRDAHVLFDPGATHSFVSLSFAAQLGKSPSSLEETLAVTTPVGEILLADCVYCSCVVSIGGKELFANLIALGMVDFDVILGMDWLASHYATLDCHNKVVKFEMPGESAFSFQGEQG